MQEVKTELGWCNGY